MFRLIGNGCLVSCQGANTVAGVVTGFADNIIIISCRCNCIKMADIAADSGRCRGIAMTAGTRSSGMGQATRAAVDLHGMDADLVSAGIAGVTEKFGVVMCF